MILNDTAIATLSEAIQKSEASISSHWRVEFREFRQDQGGFVGVRVQGHTPRGGFARRIRHYALLTPFRRMGKRFANFDEYLRSGKTIAERRGGVLDLGMIRQVLTLSLLDQHVSAEQARLPTIIIGDGWGTMASLVLSSLPKRKVVLVNLTSMLLVDLVYIMKSLPGISICLARDVSEYQSGLECDGVDVVAVCADNAEIIGHGPIGVAINIASMQEMDPLVIASYFEALRSSPNPKTLFYCCNRIEKTLPDGTEVLFQEYPWRPEDKILVDENCPWHQYYLRLRPPFQSRYDGPIWHRLAEIKKEQKYEA